MSVLIKGMEMPKNCGRCPLTFFSGGSKVCKFGCLKEVDCPLVEVPTSHCDLIDVDVLADRVLDMWERKLMRRKRNENT